MITKIVYDEYWRSWFLDDYKASSGEEAKYLNDDFVVDMCQNVLFEMIKKTQWKFWYDTTFSFNFVQKLNMIKPIVRKSMTLSPYYTIVLTCILDSQSIIDIDDPYLVTCIFLPPALMKAFPLPTKPITEMSKSDYGHQCADRYHYGKLLYDFHVRSINTHTRDIDA